MLPKSLATRHQLHTHASRRSFKRVLFVLIFVLLKNTNTSMWQKEQLALEVERLLGWVCS